MCPSLCCFDMGSLSHPARYMCLRVHYTGTCEPRTWQWLRVPGNQEAGGELPGEFIPS